jgi:hypothetical protein
MSGIFVVCSYNYEKEDEDELTITVGEKLELVDGVDENWNLNWNRLNF